LQMMEELNAAFRERTKGFTGGELGCTRCHPFIVAPQIGQVVRP
jgi:hypothetical protein